MGRRTIVKEEGKHRIGNYERKSGEGSNNEV